MRVPVAALLGLACSSPAPCPTTTVEIRAFEGEPVAGTRTTCTPLRRNALCEGGGYPLPHTSELQDRCGSSRFGVIGTIAVYHAIAFFVEDEDPDNPIVRVAEELRCDTDGCDLEVTQARSGWIMPEGSLADPRGRFHVELPGYTIEGDYDPAERPPIDAALPPDGSPP